jgi:hypothetical protein
MRVTHLKAFPLSLLPRVATAMLDRPRTTAEAEVKATRHVSAELTDDMTVTDLIEVFEHLPFRPRGAPCTVRLDRGVAMFLVRLLRER